MSFRRGPARAVALVGALLTAPIVAHADNLPSLATVPFEDLAPPTAPGSGESSLATSGETVYLQWLDGGANRALRVAAWQPGGGWGEMHTVAADPRLTVNWASFPQILSFGDGQLASAWTRDVAGKDEAAEVFAAVSADGGATWGTPARPHRDTKPAEHGFISLMRNTGGTFDVAWLDGRGVTMAGKKPPTGSMQLRLAGWQAAGGFGTEQVLDVRVCDCCQTGAARTLEGIYIAYRDRDANEVRDISGVRFDRGRWLAPQNVYPDGWKINGCPVNGPAVAAAGTNNELAVAWFSGKDDAGQVKVALSSDGGVSFRSVVRVDGGNPLGRVALEHLPDDSYAVAWIENAGGAAELRVRRVLSDGSLDVPVRAAATQADRQAGFPRLAWSGVSLFVSWTDLAAAGGQVRLGRFDWAKAVPQK